MFKSLINRIEERYVFSISQFFWHVFIAIAAVGIVGGVLLLVWGIIPTLKSSVKKEEYPPIATVSLEELQAYVNPPKRAERAKPQQQQTPPPVTPPPQEGASAEEAAYSASLDTMQRLIPPTKYSWDAEGYWEYPYGYNYPQYARWVQREPAVLERLNQAFSRSEVHAPAERKQVVDAHIAVVRLFKEESRMGVWKALILWSEPNLAQALANIRILDSLARKFPLDRSDHITKLAQFGNKNPNDGYALIEYIGKAIDKFPNDMRVDAAGALLNGYYRYFNNRVREQIETTESFLPMIRNFSADVLLKALDGYYQVSKEKNFARSQTIASIEAKYHAELAKAEADYEQARAKKSTYRLNALYGIVGGVVVVATIALLLVLLSIQRYVRLIDSKLERGNIVQAGP